MCWKQFLLSLFKKTAIIQAIGENNNVWLVKFFMIRISPAFALIEIIIHIKIPVPNLFLNNMGI